MAVFAELIGRSIDCLLLFSSLIRWSLLEFDELEPETLVLVLLENDFELELEGNNVRMLERARQVREKMKIERRIRG